MKKPRKLPASKKEVIINQIKKNTPKCTCFLIEFQHPRPITDSKLIITSITYYNFPQSVESRYKKDDEKIEVEFKNSVD